METKLINLLWQLLEWWHYDILFLIKLLTKNNIELDIEDIKNNYWKVKIGILIYNAFKIIAERFISENREQIYMILWLKEQDSLDEYMSYNELYQIYADWLDSSFWFYNNWLQTLFENSKYSI